VGELPSFASSASSADLGEDLVEEEVSDLPPRNEAFTPALSDKGLLDLEALIDPDHQQELRLLANERYEVPVVKPDDLVRLGADPPPHLQEQQEEQEEAAGDEASDIPMSGVGEEEDVGMEAMNANLASHDTSFQPLINSAYNVAIPTCAIVLQVNQAASNTLPFPRRVATGPRRSYFNIEPIFILKSLDYPVEVKGWQYWACPCTRFTKCKSAKRHARETGCHVFHEIDPVQLPSSEVPRSDRARNESAISAKLSADGTLLHSRLGKALVANHQAFLGVVDSVENIRTSMDVLNRLSELYKLKPVGNWHGRFLCWSKRIIGTSGSPCPCNDAPGIHLQIRNSATKFQAVNKPSPSSTSSHSSSSYLSAPASPVSGTLPTVDGSQLNSP